MDSLSYTYGLTIFKQKLKTFLIGNPVHKLKRKLRLLTGCFSELRIGLRAKSFTMLAEYFGTEAVKIPKDGRRS